ncbi:PREDICTED: glycine N-acyltransferase-like [Branchiostoma belcheri]|uniref:Glycine N-acyltransferase-like protein n=1 Tax=Branchiostoma belcheri TaxID=7741 RepID=A0A6P4ZUA2_BRABE|nr:PREDICTED: glycine N-acyltransferase-like [Branchiostoma belcheri]
MSCHRLSSRALQEFVNTFRLTRDLTVGPSTAKIFYTARNYLVGKIPGEMVFAVDKWPNYTAVMCASGEGTYKFMQDIETYTFYWENKDGLLKLLRDDKLVDWGKNFTIAAFAEKGLPVLNHVCSEMGKPVPQQDDLLQLYTGFLPNVLPATNRLPDCSVTLGRLGPEHAELVNRTWKWGGPPEVLEFIRYVLATFPSTCVYNKQGEPLAYTAQQPWGECGMSKALVPGRYGTFVAKSLINEVLKTVDLPYCFVEPSNEKARKIMDQELDPKWDPSGSCFYVSL